MKSIRVLKKNIKSLRKFDDALPKVLKKPLVFSSLVDYSYGEELLKVLLTQAGLKKCKFVFAFLHYSKEIRAREKLKDFSLIPTTEVDRLVFSIREQIRIAQLMAEATIVKTYLKNGKAVAPELCVLERRFSKRWSALNLKDRANRLEDLKKAVPKAQDVRFSIIDGNDIFNSNEKQVDIKQVLEGSANTINN